MGFLHPGSKRSASARAQLTTFHDLVASGIRQDGIAQHSSIHSTFQMRVTPAAGEPEFASQLSVWGGDADHLQPGRWTYVRYDPAHPSRCELDKDRLTEEFGRLYDGRNRVMVPKEVSAAWFTDTSGPG